LIKVFASNKNSAFAAVLQGSKTVRFIHKIGVIDDYSVEHFCCPVHSVLTEREASAEDDLGVGEFLLHLLLGLGIRFLAG